MSKGTPRSGEDDDEFDDDDLVRKVVRSVDGILDDVEKESEQNFWSKERGRRLKRRKDRDEPERPKRSKDCSESGRGDGESGHADCC